MPMMCSACWPKNSQMSDSTLDFPAKDEAVALDGAKTTNRGLLPPRSAVADLLVVLARQGTGQAAIHFLLYAAMLVENNKSWVCPSGKSMTSHSVGYLPFSSLPFSPSARRVDLFELLSSWKHYSTP